MLGYCMGVLLSFRRYAELCLAFGGSEDRLWRLVKPRIPPTTPAQSTVKSAMQINSNSKLDIFNTCVLVE